MNTNAKQRHQFTPFLVSTNGLLGKEAKTLLKKLSSVLAEKWEKSYAEAHFCDWSGNCSFPAVWALYDQDRMRKGCRHLGMNFDIFLCKIPSKIYYSYILLVFSYKMILPNT
jgi:hypothetical protein